MRDSDYKRFCEYCLVGPNGEMDLLKLFWFMEDSGEYWMLRFYDRSTGQVFPAQLVEFAFPNGAEGYSSRVVVNVSTDGVQPNGLEWLNRICNGLEMGALTPFCGSELRGCVYDMWCRYVDSSEFGRGGVCLGGLTSAQVGYYFRHFYFGAGVRAALGGGVKEDVPDAIVAVGKSLVGYADGVGLWSGARGVCGVCGCPVRGIGPVESVGSVGEDAEPVHEACRSYGVSAGR